MKTRTFTVRGWRAMLVLSGVAVLTVGVIALALMVGAAVAVAGLAVSAGAALYYTLRRKLNLAGHKPIWRFQDSASNPSSKTVRDIEVEVLPQNKR